MVESLDYLEGIEGIDEAIELQKEKLESLRKDVKNLKFKKIDSAGNYTSVAYKAIDGGNMKLNLNPVEINIINVADSYFNKKMSFVIPQIKGYGETPNDKTEATDKIIKIIDKNEIIQRFNKLLGCSSISEISYILDLNNSNNFMEIAEWACIFDRINLDSDEPIIIIKDGLLRSKILSSTGNKNHIKPLIEILKIKKKRAKLVGVSKTSAILSLLLFALHIEGKIPSDSIGYIKIPLDLELKAYKWDGKGKVGEKPLHYAFGEIYVVKLSKDSNLLLTVEIPKDLETGEEIYSEKEIEEIISYLAKDSRFSYPVIGYPQTIMRAHETAVQFGFPASVIKDEIKDKLISNLPKEAGDFIRDAWLTIDIVNKGILGGGKYD